MTQQLSTAPNPSADAGTSEKVITHTDLTPQQKKQWADTMSMMMWNAPGFQHLLYKLLNAQSNTPSEHVAIMSKDVPVAATDARNIIINPDTFFKMTLPERTFVLAHEIVHNVYSDVELLHRCKRNGKVPMNDGTTLPFNNDTMQKAMDARINALLIESKTGKPPKCGHYDEDVKGGASVLDVYKKYYEDEAPDSGGNNPGGFDNLQKPGGATGQKQQRNPQQWAVEIAAAQTIEQVKSQGKMSAALQRMFKEILEPVIPWTDHIETLINRAIAGDGGTDWTSPHPYWGAYDFFVPNETGKGAGWIVVWGDTSGSMSDKEIARHIAEIAGIMEQVNPQRLTMIWCDAAPSYVDEITDAADLTAIQARGVGGGGGTSYQPVMDWIRQNGAGAEPDLFIGFTDGFVSHTREPAFPVIWASSTEQTYPWGQVVRINDVARGH